MVWDLLQIVFLFYVAITVRCEYLHCEYLHKAIIHFYRTRKLFYTKL